jgi:hypothetical protein
MPSHPVSMGMEIPFLRYLHFHVEFSQLTCGNYSVKLVCNFYYVPILACSFKFLAQKHSGVDSKCQFFNC